MTATGFELHRVEVDIEFIVHDDESLNRNLVEPHECSGRATRKVHKRIGLSQNQFGAIPKTATFCHSSVCFVVLKRGRQFVGQVGQHHVAHVVAITGVAGPGVTEPDY